LSATQLPASQELHSCMECFVIGSNDSILFLYISSFNISKRSKDIFVPKHNVTRLG